MSAKTMFWYSIVALAMVGSALAKPLQTVEPLDSPVKNDNVEQTDVTQVQEKEPTELNVPVAQDKESVESTTAPAVTVGTDPTQEQSGKLEDFSDGSVKQSEPSVSTVTGENTESTVESTSPATSGTIQQVENNAGSKTSGPAMVTSDQPGSGTDQRPQPFYTGGLHTIKIGSEFPFGSEIMQPFPMPFQAFQTFPQFTYNPRIQPPRYPQQQMMNPFGFFDPFSPAQSPAPFNPFNDGFATPEVIIVKPKRQVETNNTAIPPIPWLISIVLKAFQHEQPEIMEALRQQMFQHENMGNNDNLKGGSNGKPVTKTTTKTEVIDGHVVQINETTYTDGDENHKSFYHVKEIQVLPDDEPVQKKVPEKITLAAKDDAEEAQKMETNEIKGPAVTTVDGGPSGAVDDSNKESSLAKKVSGSVSLDDHYQAAAASYYAPLAPYVVRPLLTPLYGRPHQVVTSLNYGRPTYMAPYGRPPYMAPYGRPPPPPPATSVNYGRPQQMIGPDQSRPLPAASINYGGRPTPAASVGQGNQGAGPVSLHGDTYVNELAAMKQQASGMNAVLPPDVEFVDSNGKPQRQAGQFYYNNHHSGPGKFPGSKP